MNQKNVGCSGILSLLFFSCLGLMIWVQFTDRGPEITLNGNTAEIEVTLSGYSNLRSAASSIADDVYSTAKAHPGVSKIIVNVRMSGNGLTDKYGNDLPEDRKMDMGQIIISNVREVLRYDESTYKTSDIIAASYGAQLKSMKYGYLLE